MPLPYGSYVVLGQYLEHGDAPQVHLLAEPALSFFQSQLSAAQVSPVLVQRLLYSTFNMRHADSVIPAWSGDAMSLIAQHYSGQHETELKGLCAAIALGRPFGDNARRKPDAGPEGGQPAKPQPKPRTPKGGNKVSAFQSLTTGA